MSNRSAKGIFGLEPTSQSPQPAFRQPPAILTRFYILLLALQLWNAELLFAQSTAETEHVYRPRKLHKENLGPDVNSVYSELAPIISPDGQYLFYTMGTGFPDNLGDDHLQDCYVSKKLSDGHWASPRNLGAPINSTGNDAISGVSPDGSVLFIKNFGYNHLNGLCFARSGGKAGWHLDSITIDDYSNSSSLASQCISADGKYIIFSAERSDGLGATDLYVSELRGQNHYGKPVNLGSVINTSSDEFAPFLATDSRTLYFSSRGHKGYGDADIFVSKRIGEGWTNWTTPRNLGAEVNTPGMDAYYSVPASGDVAYFSSANGANHMDIYSVTLADDVRPNPVMLVSGKVVNQQGKPIEASVTYRSLFTDSVTTITGSNALTGRFAVVLSFGQQYAVEVSAPGYLPFTDHLDLTATVPYEAVRITVKLDSATPGNSVVLNNIFFDLDQATLKPESHFELDRVYSLLAANPTWTVSLEGYTDSVGGALHNLDLSRARAEAVVNYLISRGIDSSRLGAEGLGAKDPIASNAEETGRQLNRRVMLRLQKFQTH